jgi:hypothetical protein
MLLSLSRRDIGAGDARHSLGDERSFAMGARCGELLLGGLAISAITMRRSQRSRCVKCAGEESFGLPQADAEHRRGLAL